MRKLFTLILLMVLALNLTAEISVKSFRRLDNDLDARVTAPLKDQNGAWCAIIKVVTTQTGFFFDNGMLGIMKTENKPSEIWLYVPFGTKRLTITHAKLGQLRDYMIPESVDKATCYELVLTTGKVITTVEESIESQWLLITPEPVDAMIYLNDKFVGNGIYQAKHKSGKYTYRVEAPLYHTDAGTLDIEDAKKEVNVKLKPAFGYITVNSEPEQGAKVMIDGKLQGEVTPYKSDKISKGEHVLQVIKEMYQPITKKVILDEGQTIPITVNLQPNFAELNVVAPFDATISINGINKGNGNWQGRLNAGIYTIEVEKDRHRKAKQDIEVVAGDIKTLELTPLPIFCSLDIITFPPGATIVIDDKEYGTTPNSINKLLIGSHSIQINKSGFSTLNKVVNLLEGKTIKISDSLQIFKESPKPSSQIFKEPHNYSVADVANPNLIAFRSVPSNAYILKDGEILGVTPFETDKLSDGLHSLEIRCVNFDSFFKKIPVNSSRYKTYNLNLYDKEVTFDKVISTPISNKIGNTIIIETKPPNVYLLLDGNYIGKTPATLTNLEIGVHQVELRMQDRDSVNKEIIISTEKVQRFLLKY